MFGPALQFESHPGAGCRHDLVDSCLSGCDLGRCAIEGNRETEGGGYVLAGIHRSQTNRLLPVVVPRTIVPSTIATRAGGATDIVVTDSKVIVVSVVGS